MPNLTFYADKIPTEQELLDLYQSVGWGHSKYPKMLLRAIENSQMVVCAYADDELIALGRAISDTAFAVYFPDLLVKPDWQKQGIGTKIMWMLLERYPNFHNQVLVAEDDVARDFYVKNGFKSEAYAMSIMKGFVEID
jgi:GNAT superfamily N-acetyltransferase